MGWTLPDLLALPPDDYEVLVDWLNDQQRGSTTYGTEDDA